MPSPMVATELGVVNVVELAVHQADTERFERVAP